MTTIPFTAVFHAPFSRHDSLISLEEGPFQGAKLLYKPSRACDPTDPGTDPKHSESIVLTPVTDESRPSLSSAEFFPPTLIEAFWNPGGIFGCGRPGYMELCALEVIL